MKELNPNAETIAALEEADAGEGEVFNGTAEEMVEAILESAPVSTASQNIAEGDLSVTSDHAGADAGASWLPMKSAPMDQFVLYRFAETGATIKGCIDTVTPNRVWIPERRGYYLPVKQFCGWMPIPAMPEL